MAWFYYTGESTSAVPIGNNEVVSVRPYTKVEIDDRTLTSWGVSKLVSSGEFQRCGAPSNASTAIPDKPVEMAVFEPSEFANAIEELPTGPPKVDVVENIGESAANGGKSEVKRPRAKK